jgi:hypothetical protein
MGTHRQSVSRLRKHVTVRIFITQSFYACAVGGSGVWCLSQRLSLYSGCVALCFP